MTTINSMHQTIGPVEITTTINFSVGGSVNLHYSLSDIDKARKEYDELYAVMCSGQQLKRGYKFVDGQLVWVIEP